MKVQDKILEKAHELFVRQGIRSVTMDQLAQSLAISKRTIYEHFEDKKTIVEEEAKFFYNTVKNAIDLRIGSANNVIQGIINSIEFIQEMLKGIIPTYFDEMKRYYPSAYDYIAQNKEARRFDVTYTMIKKGMEQGAFRDNINIELVSVFVNNVMLSNSEYLCEISSLKYGEFERDILFAYLKGISTEKGMILIEKEQTAYFKRMTGYGTLVKKF